MSNQNSWNKGWQDANSGKQPATPSGRTWQEREAYDAGYARLQQQQQQQQNQQVNNSGSKK